MPLGAGLREATVFVSEEEKSKFYPEFKYPTQVVKNDAYLFKLH